MKKALSLMLVVMLLCMMIPMGGLASSAGLGLFVSGVEITGTTADVLGDGSVAFDASTSTLTLKDAELLAGASDHNAITVLADSSLTKLTIALSGSNTISLNPNGGEADHNGITITKALDLKIIGSGSLNITDKGTGKQTLTNPANVSAAFFFMVPGAGSLTIGEEDGSAPSINMTCNRVLPVLALSNRMINYGTITISIPSADGMNQAFSASNLMNYGTIKISCDAHREDMPTQLMSVDGVNEGTIELTASTVGGSDDLAMGVGLFNENSFTNNGILKIKIGGDTPIQASCLGIYSFAPFINSGSCDIELNNIVAMMSAGIESFGLDNTGTINVRMTNVGRNNDKDDQIGGLMMIGPVNNSQGTINIDIGDSIASKVSGLEAAAAHSTDMTNTGKITVKIGNTPNADAKGILTEGDFSNLGSASSVDITIGRSGSTPLGQSGAGLSAYVNSADQTVTNEGSININILKEMPGQAIKVGIGKLINAQTGKINVHAREYGLYLNAASLDNQGMIYAYADPSSTLGNGVFADQTVTNTGLIYATGGTRALCTMENEIEGSGSEILNDDIDNLGLIEYNSSDHEYYIKDTTTRIKTFYSVAPLMAYKQAAIEALEEAMTTKGYVSENAQQAMEYWEEEILNATTTDEVDDALDSGLQEMADAEDSYIQAKEDAKKTLEEALDNAISDEAKQILQDAIDELDTILNSADFPDFIPPILEEAEAADKALKDAQDAAIAELEELGKTTYTSDKALAAMKDAIAAIQAATNLTDVAAALETGKQLMANNSALQKAITDAVAELEAAKSKAISDEAKAALDKAIQEVNAATTVDAVTAAKDAGLKAAEDADKALKDAQDAAIAELEELGKTTYTSDEALAAMKDAIAAIQAATNLTDVTAALETGKQLMANDSALQKAITDAVAELEAAKSKAISDEAKAALDKAIQEVKAATTVDAVTAAKDAGLKAAEDADKALKDAIATALAELDEAKATASSEAAAQIDAAKAKIAASTSVAQVDELLTALYAAIFDIRYVLLEGNGLEWVKESEVTAKFRSSAPYEKFDSVEIDGATVATSEYTSDSGSTIIWLKPSMLKKLSVGKHTIVIRSKDGLATGYFNVKPAMPPTGDNAAPFLWTALLMMSVGLAVTVLKMKRREQ